MRRSPSPSGLAVCAAALLLGIRGLQAGEPGGRQLVEEHNLAESAFGQEQDEWQTTVRGAYIGSERGMGFEVEYGLTDSWQVGAEWIRAVGRTRSVSLTVQKSWISFAGSGLDVALGAESGVAPSGERGELLAFAVVSRTIRWRRGLQLFGQTRLPTPELEGSGDPDPAVPTGPPTTDGAMGAGSTAFAVPRVEFEPDLIAGAVYALSQRARISHELAWFRSSTQPGARSLWTWSPGWYWGDATRGQWQISALVPLTSRPIPNGVLFSYVREFDGIFGGGR